jgi:hypothetical protein
MVDVNRREFLKLALASLALVGITWLGLDSTSSQIRQIEEGKKVMKRKEEKK